MRACLLATELARRAGLGDRVGQSDVFYATPDALRRLRGDLARDAAAAFGGDDVRRPRARGPDRRRPPAGGAAVPGRAGRRRRQAAGAGRAPGAARICRGGRPGPTARSGADLDRRLRLPDAVGRAVLCGVRTLRRPWGRRPGWPARTSRRRRGSRRSASRRSCSTPSAARPSPADDGAPAGPAAPSTRRSPRSSCEAPGELLRISSPDDVWAAVVDTEPRPRRRSATRRAWTRRWPGSATRPTSRRRSSRDIRAASPAGPGRR